MAEPKPVGEDICVWPHGFYCYRDDLEAHLASMSDDFEVIPFDSPRWHAFVREHEGED